MEIKSNKKNELFKRQELVLIVKGNKNPGFAGARKQISEKIGKPEENIDIRKVNCRFGQSEFKVEAHIYNSKEELEKINFLRMSKKQKEGIKKAGEDAKKTEEEAKKEETKKEEEKGEEVKSEEIKK